MKREFDPVKKPYTLSILVRDIPGVLSQVARLFSRKGYNIESIVSGGTDKPGVTRITIVILGDELMVDQIAAQCRKLIPVLAVKILDEATSIQREFALIKVWAGCLLYTSITICVPAFKFSLGVPAPAGGGNTRKKFLRNKKVK